ncbi:MAG: VCBS repeat-containing protein [Acidobacteriales bacterium]|nr:VCBS repeat-containing protein [Terriglobales bacterium]
MLRTSFACTALLACLGFSLVSLSSAQEFLVAPSYRTGTNPKGLASGDLNRDGYPDLVTANENGNSISVLLNNAGRGFQKKVDYATCGPNPGFVVLADFNSDEKLDAAVTYGTSDGFCLMLGNGDGSFQPGTQIHTGQGVSYLAVGDLNSDGKLDILAGEIVASSQVVLLGAGDGTFALGQTYLICGTPTTLGDFDNDGKLDFAVTAISGIDLALGNGDGTFQSPIFTEAGTDSMGLAAADFNGDGRLDLFVADFYNSSVLLGKGDGTFQKPIFNHTAVSRVTIGDFNRDGTPDMIADQGILLIGTGKGDFLPPVYYGAGNFPYTPVVADLDRDGIPDIAISNSSSYANRSLVFVLIGNGNGSFKARAGYPPASPGYAAVAGDFNRDGKIDLLTTNLGTKNVTVLLNQGFGTFLPAGNFDVGKFPKGIVNADFNGDGLLDAAVADSDDDTVSLLLGNGDSTFQSHIDYRTGVEPIGIVAADVSNDGKLDLVTCNDSSTISVLLGNGDGTFQAHRDFTSDIAGYNIAAGDLNGDGNIDVAVTAQHSVDAVSVFFGAGDGNFGSPVQLATGRGANAVLIADIDLDRKLDIATANENSVSVLLSNGDGTFQPHKDSLAASPSSITTADFNGDGKPDLATGSVSGLGSVLLGNGNGTFQPYKFYDTGEGQYILAANLNGDRAPDLAIVDRDFPGAVSVLLNTGGSVVSASSTPNPSTQGQPVTFTISIAGSLHAAPVPTGTVTLKDRNNILTTLTLGPGGSARFITSSLSAGSHRITTTYSGDATYNPNTGNVITQIVN